MNSVLRLLGVGAVSTAAAMFAGGCGREQKESVKPADATEVVESDTTLKNKKEEVKPTILPDTNSRDLSPSEVIDANMIKGGFFALIYGMAIERSVNEKRFVLIEYNASQVQEENLYIISNVLGRLKEKGLTHLAIDWSDLPHKEGVIKSATYLKVAAKQEGIDVIDTDLTMPMFKVIDIADVKNPDTASEMRDILSGQVAFEIERAIKGKGDKAKVLVLTRNHEQLLEKNKGSLASRLAKRYGDNSIITFPMPTDSK